MAQHDLPPMAPGGQWIQMSPDKPIVYVVHPDHIKRLMADGGQVVADPRRSAHKGVEDEPPAPIPIKRAKGG